MTEVDTTKATELDHAVIKYVEESESGKATIGEILTYVSSGLTDLFDHMRGMQSRGLIVMSISEEGIHDTLVKLPCR